MPATLFPEHQREGGGRVERPSHHIASHHITSHRIASHRIATQHITPSHKGKRWTRNMGTGNGPRATGNAPRP